MRYATWNEGRSRSRKIIVSVPALASSNPSEQRTIRPFRTKSKGGSDGKGRARHMSETREYSRMLWIDICSHSFSPRSGAFVNEYANTLTWTLSAGICHFRFNWNRAPKNWATLDFERSRISGRDTHGSRAPSCEWSCNYLVYPHSAGC